MKKLTTIVLTLVTALFLTAGMTMAKGKPTTSTWSGTLIDKHCGAKMASDASGHEKACVMKCAKNGKDLGMLVDGKWYSFDKKGEKLGWSLLEKSKADNNIQVTVTGTMKGKKIAVKSIDEKA